MAYQRLTPEESRVMARALPAIVQAVVDFRAGSVPTNQEDDNQLTDARNAVHRALKFGEIPQTNEDFRNWVYEHAQKGVKEGAEGRGTGPETIMPHPVDQSPESPPVAAGPRAHQNRPEGQAL